VVSTLAAEHHTMRWAISTNVGATVVSELIQS
jgi:hypothetical protein